MRLFASLTALSLTLFALTGCPASSPACPPDGTGTNTGTGLYCAYGVVVGGFRGCPTGMPNRFDFPDGSFVCSDRPIGSRDAIPDEVCRLLPACSSEPADVGTPDGGMPDGGGMMCPAEGRVECAAAQACCGGAWRPITVASGTSGPCIPAAIPDSGVPPMPDCVANPLSVGCPCMTEGAFGCPPGSSGTLLSHWRLVCTGGTWAEDRGFLCC